VVTDALLVEMERSIFIHLLLFFVTISTVWATMTKLLLKLPTVGILAENRIDLDAGRTCFLPSMSVVP